MCLVWFFLSSRCQLFIVKIIDPFHFFCSKFRKKFILYLHCRILQTSIYFICKQDLYQNLRILYGLLVHWENIMLFEVFCFLLSLGYPPPQSTIFFANSVYFRFSSSHNLVLLHFLLNTMISFVKPCHLQSGKISVLLNAFHFLTFSSAVLNVTYFPQPLVPFFKPSD
jgi:hypothetical protein